MVPLIVYSRTVTIYNKQAFLLASYSLFVVVMYQSKCGPVPWEGRHDISTLASKQVSQGNQRSPKRWEGEAFNRNRVTESKPVVKPIHTVLEWGVEMTIQYHSQAQHCWCDQSGVEQAKRHSAGQ